MEAQSDIFMPFVAKAPDGPVRPTNAHDGLGLCLNGPPDNSTAQWSDDSLTLLKPAAYNDWVWGRAGQAGYFSQCCDLYPDDPNIENAMRRAREIKGTWLLGNEPDLAGLGDMPRIIQFTRKWAMKVGGSWAGLGIIAGDGHSHGWLDAYLKAGGPVGDHWHIHIYFLNNANEWEVLWNEWKRWMSTRKVERPTIVSETAGWDPNVDQRPILDRIVRLQENDPLLDAVLWYSVFDYWERWPWSNLRNKDGTLTPLGTHFRAIQATR